MYVDDQGVVLQSIHYDDRSSVVRIFTASRGVVPFMVTRPKSRRSTNASLPPLLAPLSVLAFQWDEKPVASLFRLRDAHLHLVWRDIPFHPVKSAVALLLAEFLSHSLHGEGENSELYDYICESLKWFDGAEEGFANFHLVFLIGVLRMLGVAPDASSYRQGYSFDLQSGVFVPALPAGPSVLNSEDAETFCSLISADFDSMRLIQLSHTDRARLTTYLNRYYIFHIPGFPVVKSLSVLEGLFS